MVIVATKAMVFQGNPNSLSATSYIDINKLNLKENKPSYSPLFQFAKKIAGCDQSRAYISGAYVTVSDQTNKEAHVTNLANPV